MRFVLASILFMTSVFSTSAPTHAQVASFGEGKLDMLDPITTQSNGSTSMLQQMINNDDMQLVADLASDDVTLNPWL